MALGRFDYAIESVKLLSSTGESLEMKDLVISLDIYESLLSPYIKVELGVVDAANFIETAPIIGQEKVELTFTEGGKRIKKTLYVGGIDGYVRPNNQAATYTLKLITPEQMMNGLLLVSQAYSGTVSKAIDGIVTDYLKSKVKTLEETNGNYKVIIPNWNPFKAIDWLQRRAITAKQIPFAFYETYMDGFALESYETMFKKPTYAKFVHKGGNQGKDDAESLKASYNVAIDYDLRDYSNTYKQVLTGAFGSGMHTVDIASREYKFLKYDYMEDFKKKPRMDKVPFINEDFKIDNKSLNQYDSIHSIANKNQFSFEDSLQNYNNEVQFTKLEADPFVQQLTLTKMNITVRGRTDLTPGKMIEFEVDRDKPIVHGNIKDSNEYISGKYLVMNVRHKMVDGKYTIVMDCVRDSLGKKVKKRG
jgi:hypothetical protein